MSSLRFLVGAAALVAVAIAGYASSSGVGSFRMFTRLERVRIELFTEHSNRTRRWQAADVVDHLSRDGQRVLLPMLEGAPVETQGALLASRGEQLAAWLCDADPDARFANVAVHRPSGTRHHRVRCD
ncbi:MAG: hypothetical protein AAGE52_42845 [Myxococcota bacterium]